MNDEPAFPICEYDTSFNPPLPVTSRGMTLRDYFAAHEDIPWDAAKEGYEMKYPEKKGKVTVSELAAYRALLKLAEADAMLEARQPKEGE